VAIDAHGDVVAAGGTVNHGRDVDFTVVKLQGSDGAERWRYSLGGTADTAPDFFDGSAVALAIDQRGDILAGGLLLDTGTYDFAVVKLAGGNGHEMWRRVIDGPGHTTDSCSALAVARDNDVIATGFTQGGPGSGFTVMRLSARDGATLWDRRIQGSGNVAGDWAGAVALDRADVVAAGSMFNLGSDRDFTVVKLRGNTGRSAGCHREETTCQPRGASLVR
jgi:hypothetical protein